MYLYFVKDTAGSPREAFPDLAPSLPRVALAEVKRRAQNRLLFFN